MTNKKSREKSERELLEDIKRLLVIIATKGKTTQEEVGKCLGVGKTQINNILAGVGTKKDGKTEN